MADLTQARLKELFDYSADTGQFTRNVAVKGFKSGSLAGSVDSNGYIKVRVDGGRYMAHRLAYLWMTGAIPDTEVDHINGIKSDNRWNNLRESDHSTNNCNRQVQANSSTGIKGLTLRKNGKFQASVQRDGTRINKEFKDSASAAEWLNQMRERMHGQYANHGQWPVSPSVPDGFRLESKRLIPILQSFADRLANNGRSGLHHAELYEADHDTLMEAVRHLKQIAAAPKVDAPPAPVVPRPIQRWPFAESPGEFAQRLRDAMVFFGDALPAIRNVVIENPPTLSRDYLWHLTVAAPEVPRG